MENLLLLFLLIFIIRLGGPVLFTWFFETFVEPKAQAAREMERTRPRPAFAPTNAGRISALRKELDTLRRN